jgi:hypothetical protein
MRKTKLFVGWLPLVCLFVFGAEPICYCLVKFYSTVIMAAVIDYRNCVPEMKSNLTSELLPFTDTVCNGTLSDFVVILELQYNI